MKAFSENKNEPIYSISSAATLLHISVHTLRMYEREGLIIPFKRESKQRLYSRADIERLECIRNAINQMKISINGIKVMYALIPCWEIIKCSENDRKKCSAYNQHTDPCWSKIHPNTICENKSCRDCDVYKKHSQCGEIKELIKSISR
jgi:MerR family transcriptional regulator/heat shock protein HspR